MPKKDDTGTNNSSKSPYIILINNKQLKDFIKTFGHCPKYGLTSDEDFPKITYNFIGMATTVAVSLYDDPKHKFCFSHEKDDHPTFDEHGIINQTECSKKKGYQKKGPNLIASYDYNLAAILYCQMLDKRYVNGISTIGVCLSMPHSVTNTRGWQTA